MNRLRWLGRVLRREDVDAIRLVKGIYVERKKGKMKTKKEVFGCDRKQYEEGQCT